MDETTAKWWDRSLNPFVGCAKTSAGCRLCWAERCASTRLLHHPSYQGVVDEKGWTGKVRKVPSGVRKIAGVKKGIIFLCDMGDIFHGDFAEASVRFRQVVAGIAKGAHKGSTARFCVLTKRAATMERVVMWFLAQPDTLDDWKRALSERIWLGVSAEHSDALAQRVHHLYGLPCAGTFISAEPLLGSLRMGGQTTLRGVLMAAPRPGACVCGTGHGFTRCPYTGGVARASHRTDAGCEGFVREKGAGIDWVITGAESGPGAVPPDFGWFAEIVRDCIDTCTPLYVKQVGAHPYVLQASMHEPEHVTIEQRGHGGCMQAWPEELRVRQWPVRLRQEASAWSK
jgi:protein gp37